LFFQFNGLLSHSINLIPTNFMEKACSLDVRKDSVFACILDEEGKKNFEKRFGTLTPDLIALRDAIVAHDCGSVAMESTGACMACFGLRF
jgi:hypothetical protein